MLKQRKVEMFKIDPRGNRIFEDWKRHVGRRWMPGGEAPLWEGDRVFYVRRMRSKVASPMKDTLEDRRRGRGVIPCPANLIRRNAGNAEKRTR